MAKLRGVVVAAAVVVPVAAVDGSPVRR